MNEELPLPPEAPVMALPNAILFPNTLLPLHIFEERYREMLAYALEHHRMFCVALIKPGITEPAGYADLFPVAGIGLIRVCVGDDDGTSNLVLQGMARVRLFDFVQETPFRIARIEKVDSTMQNPTEAEALGAKVIELCGELKAAGVDIAPALRQEIAHLVDPEVVCDKVANALVEDTLRRQALLEERTVATRLRLLISYLRQKFT